MDGRVRWFFGLARNDSGYSLPMMGTPCDVPDPRKVKLKDIQEGPRSKVQGPKKTQAPRSKRQQPMIEPLRVGNLETGISLGLEPWTLDLIHSFITRFLFCTSLAHPPNSARINS